MKHPVPLITALLLPSATVANGQLLEIADLETRMLARLRVSLLTDIPDGKRRHRLPQGVVRRKHPVIPMPVPLVRRDQRCQPVKKLKRCQLDDTTGPGPRRLSRASGADPATAFLPGTGSSELIRAGPQCLARPTATAVQRLAGHWSEADVQVSSTTPASPDQQARSER
jgi:hypothetical protein